MDLFHELIIYLQKEQMQTPKNRTRIYMHMKSSFTLTQGFVS